MCVNIHTNITITVSRNKKIRLDQKKICDFRQTAQVLNNLKATTLLGFPRIS